MAQVYNNFSVKCIMIVLFVVSVLLCESYVLIKDDTMVESTQGIVQKPQTKSMRSKRNAVVDRKKIWEFGVVPYEIDTTAEFDSTTIFEVKAATRHWENFTCVTFVERNATEHKDFIRFTDEISGYGCASSLGKVGGGQTIAIGSCYIGSIIHELGHAIGFHHEHQRPDRDEYVEIIEDNFGENGASQFKKLLPNEVDTLDEPYDHDSIMHYDSAVDSKYKSLEFRIRNNGYALFRGQRFTLRDIAAIMPKKRKDGTVPEIGQRKRLSAIDIRKTNKLYKCPECGRTYFDPYKHFGAFSSPEYNNKSTNHRTYRCEWRIIVIEGERIQLKISDLDIFKTTDCKSDYLEIRDGYWHKSPLLGRLCGTNVSNRFVSTGNRMIIKYVSSHMEHRGFTASYRLDYNWLDD